jgi:phospholipid/cholesterol/gamma-HCH transport system substrate-binding protein
MSPARASLLVGLVLVVTAVTLTWFVTSTSKDQFSERDTYELYADFTDASGIRWKTRVQIAGIDVGKIQSIELEPVNGRLVARVKILLLNQFDVYANAEIRKAAESLLGDYRLDVDPGGPYDVCDEGRCAHRGFKCVDKRMCIKPCAADNECLLGQVCTDSTCRYKKLNAGDVIRNVQSRADLEEIQAQLKEVAQNVNEVTQSISHVLAGPEGEGSIKTIMARVERSMEAIEEATKALSGTLTRNDEAIDDIIRDVHTVSSSLARATSEGGDLSRIAGHLASVAERLDKLADNVNSAVAGEGGPGEAGSLRNTLDNLNQSVAHLAGVTRKIDEGQGTLGRVINDPAIAEKIEQTLDDTNQLLGGVSRLETQIELRTQYEVPVNPNRAPAEVSPAIKNTLSLRLLPKPDKYYIIEAIADPRGRSERKITTTNTNCEGSNCDPNAGQHTETTEETTIEFDELKFSAQFAKRYYFLTLRFGIIESTGGLGFNLHGLEEKLELRVDLFDFNRRLADDPGSPRRPRLRTTAMFEFVDHLHVQGGVDDFFNPGLFTWFVGGVLRFTDEDLKAILTVAPTPSP